MYRQFHVLYAFLLLYGSVLPFDVQLQDFASVRAEFIARSVLSWRLLHSGEAVSNYFLYVPLGFLLGMRRLDRASTAIWRFTSTLCWASALSFSAELAQAFLITRYASFLDVFLNLAGTCLGFTLADVFSAQLNQHQRRLSATVVALRRYRLEAVGVRIATFTAVMYAAFLTLLFLPPIEELCKARELLMTLPKVRNFFQVPFLDFQSLDYLPVLQNAVIKLALFLPMGVLLGSCVALKKRSARQRRRASLFLAPWVLAAVLSIEIAQLFSSGHTASISDSCLYLLGLAIGWSLSSAMRAQSIGARKAERSVKFPSLRPSLVS